MCSSYEKLAVFEGGRILSFCFVNLHEILAVFVGERILSFCFANIHDLSNLWELPASDIV